MSYHKSQRRLHLEVYARVVFQLPFKTVLIESLFSIMNLKKDKHRASLNDESMPNIIHTRDVAPMTDDPAAPFAATNLVIDGKGALKHRLKW